MTWDTLALSALAATEEITIETARSDGSFRDPVPIWIVRLGDDLYVRSSHGRQSGWFRGAVAEHRARVSTEGTTSLVSLVEVNGREDALDDAYAKKYRQYADSFLPALLGAPARSAALRLDPIKKHEDVGT